MRVGAPSRAFGRHFLRVESLAIAALTLVLLLVYPAARDTGVFQLIEGQTLDWRFQARGARQPSDDIVIVAVDEATLSEAGRWPFPREWLARTIDVLETAGARVIVFDLLLTGAEGESALSNPALLVARSHSGASGDELLAEAIRRAGNVLVPYAFSFDPAAGTQPSLPQPVRNSAYRLVIQGGTEAPAAAAPAVGTLLPLTPFLEEGWPAHVTVLLEQDGKVRFAHPAIRFGDEYYPSLAVEAARLFLGLDRSAMALRTGRSLKLGERSLPLDGRMGMALNYAGPEGTFPQYSLADTASERVHPSAFRGKVVLVGATAEALGDRFQSPYSLQFPGVELVATMVDNVLTGRPLDRGVVVERWDLATILAAGFLSLGLPLLRRPLAVGIAAAGFLAGWAVLTGYMFTAHLVWLNATFPALLVLLGAGVTITGRTVRETRMRSQAERQQELLAHYVSPLTAAGLAEMDSVRGDGRQSAAAVMFVDLVGYTQTSEHLQETGTAAMLRRFHGLVEQQVSVFGGTIDKFMGDAAMVVFGLPAPSPRDAANAVACARSLAALLCEKQGTRAFPAASDIRCGIGIHFGPVILTELGGHAHRQITITGDTVNVASRLEGLTRDWGATIIVSEEVLDATRAAGEQALTEGFERLPVDTVRGRSRPVSLWAWRHAHREQPAPA